MRILVDTSVWSLALRHSGRERSAVVAELQGLVRHHLVEILGAIRQELLSGVREQTHFDLLQEHLADFPDLPVLSDDYVTAAKFSNLCRAKGVQGSNTDFLICAVSVRANLAVFTTDKDFTLYSKYLPIVLHEMRPHR